MLQNLALIEFSWCGYGAESGAPICSQIHYWKHGLRVPVSCIARCDFHVLFHMEPSSVSIEPSRKNPLSSTLQIPVLNPSNKIFRGWCVLSCQPGKEYTYTFQKLGYSWLERRTWSPWPAWIPWSAWWKRFSWPSWDRCCRITWWKRRQRLCWNPRFTRTSR